MKTLILGSRSPAPVWWVSDRIESLYKNLTIRIEENEAQNRNKIDDLIEKVTKNENNILKIMEILNEKLNHTNQEELSIDDRKGNFSLIFSV